MKPAPISPIRTAVIQCPPSSSPAQFRQGPLRGTMLTMELHELLIELFGRVTEHVHEAVDGLDVGRAGHPAGRGPTPSVGWCGTSPACRTNTSPTSSDEDQVWVTGDWAGRFGLAADPDNTGYGHSWNDVLSIRPESAEALVEYYEAVARALATARRTTAEDLDRIVDERWDPP